MGDDKYVETKYVKLAYNIYIIYIYIYIGEYSTTTKKKALKMYKRFFVIR